MTSKINNLMSIILKNSNSARPTHINCNVSDVQEQAGLTDLEFHEIINQLKDNGLINTVLGNNQIVDILITKKFPNSL